MFYQIFFWFLIGFIAGVIAGGLLVLSIFTLAFNEGKLAFKEKAELTNLYWSNSAFQRNIKKVCEDRGIPEVEVLAEMAYTNADVIISTRSKNQENHESGN